MPLAALEAPAAGDSAILPVKKHYDDADAHDVNDVENGRDSDVRAGVVHTSTQSPLIFYRKISQC